MFLLLEIEAGEVSDGEVVVIVLVLEVVLCSPKAERNDSFFFSTRPRLLLSCC